VGLSFGLLRPDIRLFKWSFQAPGEIRQSGDAAVRFELAGFPAA
jgi:hypothetical protein